MERIAFPLHSAPPKQGQTSRLLNLIQGCYLPEKPRQTQPLGRFKEHTTGKSIGSYGLCVLRSAAKITYNAVIADSA